MGVDNEGFAAPGSFPPASPPVQPVAPPPPPVPTQPVAPNPYDQTSPPNPYTNAPPVPNYGSGYPGFAPQAPQMPVSAGVAQKSSNGGLIALCVVLALVAGVIGGVAGALVLAPETHQTVTLPPPTPEGEKGGSTSNSSKGDVASVADAVLPSVVSIEAGTSGGSGFVVRSDGYLLTNHHVIASADGAVTVTFSDGRKEEAEVIGSTSSYDVAVLKVNRDDLIPLELADSERVEVGEQVVAIGAPLGLEGTVTTGIVSALNRPVAAGDHIDTAFINAIQTDTAINPGNSGGPLVNMSGQVVGIASAIAQVPGSSGSIGLGFAIPANQVRRTADQLIDTGKATYPIVGVLLDNFYGGEGVQVLDDDSAETGAVSAGGPADAAGIKPGDVILAIDGRPVTHPNELIVAIRSKAPGDEVVLKIRPKDGSGEKELALVLDETESE